MSRVRRWLKQAARPLGQMIFPGQQAFRWFRFHKRIDYAEAVGDGTKSSIVLAVVGWISRTFPEAPLQVKRLDRDGELAVVSNHPLTTLLRRPNPWYSGILLWMATLVEWTVHGNAYWLKVRSSAGRVVALLWIPQHMIEPRWPIDGTEYISHYEYMVNGRAYSIAPEDIVHFRYGLDPQNPRKGLSPLGAVIREIYTDEEAANYTATILHNVGMPSAILSPSKDTPDWGQEEAEGIRDSFRAKFGGDNRGDVMVARFPLNLQQLSWSPQQLNLRDLRRIPEERISAVFGVAAIVCGLGAGLDRSTFSNFKEAAEQAWENNIIPTQRLMAAELETQLLGDFADEDQYQIGFDISGVRALQEDQTAKVNRETQLYLAGGQTRDELRSHLGLSPAVEGGDRYYIPVGQQVNAVGILIRSGFDPAASLTAMGLETIPHTGLLPVTVREDSVDTGLAGRSSALFKQTPARRLEERCEEAMAAFLAGQAERVAERLLELEGAGRGNGTETKLIGDIARIILRLFPGQEELRILRGVLFPFWREAARQGWEAGSVVVDLDRPFDDDDRDVRKLLARADTVLEGIDLTTREGVRAFVERRATEGLSSRQIAEEMLDSGLFSRARARTIARTEMARSENLGQSAAWRASGVVSEVKILDGSECGWTAHDDPDRAHGSVRSLEDLEAFPTAHPNCVRVPVPLVE